MATLTTDLIALEMFIQRNKKRVISEYFRVGNDAVNSMIRRSINYLNRKHNLGIVRNSSCIYRHIITPKNLETLHFYLKKELDEINENEADKPTPEIYDKIIEVIKEIQKDRIEIVKQQNKLNSKMVHLERLIHNKIK